MQEFNISHLDAVGSLSHPPILAGTAVSALLLIVATILWLSWWFRLSEKRLAVRKVLLVLLGCAIYLFAGVFQGWLCEVFYRRYTNLDASVTLGLWVPVAPVWVAGVISAIVFLVAHALRRARTQRN